MTYHIPHATPRSCPDEWRAPSPLVRRLPSLSPHVCPGSPNPSPLQTLAIVGRDAQARVAAMRTVVVCSLDARVRRALAEDLGRSVRLLACDDYAKVLATARAAQASTVVCEVGTTPDARRRTTVMLRQLTSSMPEMTVVVVGSLGRGQVPALLESIRAGAHAVALRPHDDAVYAGLSCHCGR